MDRLLREALATHVVEDEDTPPNYSLQLGLEPQEGGRRPLHLLRNGGITLVRTRSAGRAIEALLRHLGAHADVNGAARLRIAGTAFTRGREAVIVPPWISSQRLLGRERHMARLGLRVVDGPGAELDPDTGELVVSPPPLDVDRSVLAAVDGDGDEIMAGQGRYRVRAWGLVPDDNQPVAFSGAVAVAHGMAMSTNLTAVGAQRALDCLAAVFRHARPVKWPVHGDNGLDRVIATFAADG